MSKTADLDIPHSAAERVARADLLRAMTREIELLRLALDESVKLQSHYAVLLNIHDGGKRTTFPDGPAWLSRIMALSSTHEPVSID